MRAKFSGSCRRSQRIFGPIAWLVYTPIDGRHQSMAAGSGESWPESEAVPITFDGRFLAINDIVR